MTNILTNDFKFEDLSFSEIERIVIEEAAILGVVGESFNASYYGERFGFRLRNQWGLNVSPRKVFLSPCTQEAVLLFRVGQLKAHNINLKSEILAKRAFKHKISTDETCLLGGLIRDFKEDTLTFIEEADNDQERFDLLSEQFEKVTGVHWPFGRTTTNKKLKKLFK